eukprot:TRINITY_DN71200_c0_g1_i1.p1 TRINITY_DN71200_c0_g1~~TRINITY_DN71200_c0_g1_i1.p1  ORF type:complete len:277 (+),score=42.24 TRINITY_DN71200_c0_g1_i1:65-895(+)
MAGRDKTKNNGEKVVDTPFEEKLSRHNSLLDFHTVNILDAMFISMAKDRKICQLDCVTLLRAIGMCPTDADLRPFFDRLNIRDAVREAEERRTRDERMRKELEDAQNAAAMLTGAKRETVKNLKEKKVATGGRRDEQKSLPWVPPERRPVVTWSMFLAALQPEYKDLAVCEAELRQAWAVFDKNGSGTLDQQTLLSVLTGKGTEPLAPQEVKSFLEVFTWPNVSIDDICHALAGTLQPRPQSAGPSGRLPSAAGSQRAPSAGASGRPASTAGSVPG